MALMADHFEKYLLSDSGPQMKPTGSIMHPTVSTATIDVTAITNAIPAATLSKPPALKTDIFMKLLNEAKQWNTWQCNFLSLAHSDEFKNATDEHFRTDPYGGKKDSNKGVRRAKVVWVARMDHITTLISTATIPSLLPIMNKCILLLMSKWMIVLSVQSFHVSVSTRACHVWLLC